MTLQSFMNITLLWFSKVKGSGAFFHFPFATRWPSQKILRFAILHLFFAIGLTVLTISLVPIIKGSSAALQRISGVYSKNIMTQDAKRMQNRM